ncbi:MAG: SET domain-containing protein [Bacteroidetes bacterium]|nr:SET domain-containing protein [Bacteroidota bacterium]
MQNDFVVKKSTLPDAGKGLFTKIDIKKGERFMEYHGEIVTEAELNRRAENDIFGYAFYISKKKCIDAYYTPHELARYANDAKGLNKVKGLNNNACYVVYKNSGWIKAEKNIKAGEEIFVSYGAEYWKDIRYNIKLDKERQAEKAAKKKSVKKTATKKKK